MLSLTWIKIWAIKGYFKQYTIFVHCHMSKLNEFKKKERKKENKTK